MKPLGTQTSKTMAKLIICLIWVLSLTLASPLGFFYDLKYMQDEATGKANSHVFARENSHSFSCANNRHTTVVEKSPKIVSLFFFRNQTILFT